MVDILLKGGPYEGQNVPLPKDGKHEIGYFWDIGYNGGGIGRYWEKGQPPLEVHRYVICNWKVGLYAGKIPQPKNGGK